MTISSIEQRINQLLHKLSLLDDERTCVVAEIDKLQLQLEKENQTKSIPIPVSQNYTSEEKIRIFMQLFRGRADVLPKRWDNKKTGKSGYSPACNNEWVSGICNKPQIKCSECHNQSFIALDEVIIRKHLSGDRTGAYKKDYTIGIYPMLKDETCWFLAADFDKQNWQSDAGAFLATCKRRNIPASLERSRSGNGGHIWIFFSEPVPASEARRMGSALLTETMEQYPNIGFESYDRFFPNQDTMPSGGFGNLIALPLQRLPRENDNSVFLDENFVPYPDQWEYLANIRKMTPAEIYTIVEEAVVKGKILGVRMPLEDEQNPCDMLPSRSLPEINIQQNLPESIEIVLSNQVFIEKENLPPPIINRLIRLAAFQNPEFYIAQSMRLSTFGKPRIIACAENFPKHIGLPRGCIDGATQLLKSLGIKTTISDKRNSGRELDAKFLGELTLEQQNATKELLKYETGILAATTAFGKTVIAANIIAARKTNSLVLLHRRQLLEQWVARLQTFLDIPTNHIGVIGGGKRKPSGIIDIAVIQSLTKNNIVDDIVADYGQVIVDECHHLSAVSFEAVARASKAKYFLGLTATATRKDGHHPIIFMQCGEIRYKVDAKQQANLRPFTHKAIIRHTDYQFINLSEQKPSIQQIYASIIADNSRNQMIISDVLQALQAGRSPLLLTERKEHAAFLAAKLEKFCKNIVVMVGGQKAKQLKAVKQQLESITEAEERLIIATGRYIGEGFDDSRLDTLFLTMPISWQGTLAQYAGRLHRLHHSKKEVIIYDYVDNSLPMLAKMAEKRLKGYDRLGYNVAGFTDGKLI
ncbi:MAG: DEAD/DEAH box helicase family protein [Pseudomonadota bacterium]